MEQVAVEQEENLEDMYLDLVVGLEGSSHDIARQEINVSNTQIRNGPDKYLILIFIKMSDK